MAGSALKSAVGIVPRYSRDHWLTVGLLAGLMIGFNIWIMRGIGSSCLLASDHVTTDASKHQSRAVIHMGIHKTGTSSIQSFLQRNVEYLLSDGYKILGSDIRKII